MPPFSPLILNDRIRDKDKNDRRVLDNLDTDPSLSRHITRSGFRQEGPDGGVKLVALRFQ